MLRRAWYWLLGERDRFIERDHWDPRDLNTWTEEEISCLCVGLVPERYYNWLRDEMIGTAEEIVRSAPQG